MLHTFDITRARQETLACQNIIHFNNAGASLMPTPVSQALHRYLHQEERMGGYETEAFYKASLNNTYASAAKLLNCSAHEIAFVENATRAWEMAFYSFKFNPGDKILTTLAEYGSNVVAYIQQSQRLGVEVVFVPNDEFGQIDITALGHLIDDTVKLISMSHIPTGSGLVNPAKAVGKIAKAAGIPFLLDACQSVGHIPIDVQDIGCDLLCITGRKYLRGSRGTGLLYVRQSLLHALEPPMLDQHAAQLISPTEYVLRPDSKRFENWEQFCAGKYALGVAIDYALAWGLDAIQARNYQLAENLRQQLRQLDGIKVTDVGQEQCGIVTFTAQQLAPIDIKQALGKQQINVSVSGGAGSLVSFQHRGLTQVVRASVHYFNTDAEIDHFIAELKQVLIKRI